MGAKETLSATANRVLRDRDIRNEQGKLSSLNCLPMKLSISEALLAAREMAMV